MKTVTLTKSEKISLGTKEISKRIRQQLKAEYPLCKFSVIMDSYSGGSSININLMESNFQVKQKPEELTDQAICEQINRNKWNTEKEIRERQANSSHQLNQYQLQDDYNKNKWCNGVFLTEAGHRILRKVVEIVNQYNYNDSDIQTDYFDANFYLHIELGKWNKPFKEVF